MVIHVGRELVSVQMKTGVEQAVYALMILSMLPDKAVLPGEAISKQLKTSPTYSQKLLRRLVRENLIASVPGQKAVLNYRKNRKKYEFMIFIWRLKDINLFIPQVVY